MLLCGIKFGLGFRLGMDVFTGLVMAESASHPGSPYCWKHGREVHTEKNARQRKWSGSDLPHPRLVKNAPSSHSHSARLSGGRTGKTGRSHDTGMACDESRSRQSTSILRESIAMAIVTLDDVEVVIGAAHEAAILRSMKQHKPDWLILSLEFRHANPRLCRAVLSQHPETFILGIGPRTLTVYWYEVIVRSAREECSLQTILDFLRTIDGANGGRSPNRHRHPDDNSPKTRAPISLIRIDGPAKTGPKSSPPWPARSIAPPRPNPSRTYGQMRRLLPSGCWAFWDRNNAGVSFCMN
jgi:hypothetical protein